MESTFASRYTAEPIKKYECACCAAHAGHAVHAGLGCASLQCAACAGLYGLVAHAPRRRTQRWWDQDMRGAECPSLSVRLAKGHTWRPPPVLSCSAALHALPRCARFPKHGAPADVVYQLIKDLRALDATPRYVH